MLDKAENAFRAFITALQIAKLYDLEHLKFKKALENAYEVLKEFLAEKPELVLGIVGEELAYEKEVLFDLSKSIKPMILFLKSREIERIGFSRAVTKEELAKFISFLMMHKDEIKKQPQEYLATMGVRNISAGKLRANVDTTQVALGDVQTAISYISLYNSSLDSFSKSLESVMDSEAVDYSNIRFGVINIFENLSGRYQEMLKLTVVKRYDINTFVHILNVSILSMYFSFKLGVTKDDIIDIGMAALFHDIGKMYISRRVVKKTDKLTNEEFEMIKGHTVFGAQILLKYVESLGILPVVVAFEHHLRADNKSYPKLFFPEKPHLASSIIAVCDVYDALSGRRTYKASYSANMVYEIMMKEKDRFSDPFLIDRFFDFMGVWPIGTIVSLEDKSIAIVREQSDTDKFRPKVQIVYPQKQDSLLDLSISEDTPKIVGSLDPKQEGKEYAPLI